MAFVDYDAGKLTLDDLETAVQVVRYKATEARNVLPQNRLKRYLEILGLEEPEIGAGRNLLSSLTIPILAIVILSTVLGFFNHMSGNILVEGDAPMSISGSCSRPPQQRYDSFSKINLIIG
jgi:hypothetical protein